jgi:hypothetical protein
MAKRLMGQDTELLLVVGGQPVDAISTIKDFSFEFEQETKDEGYVGETTNRKDAVFKGVKGSFTMHLTTKAQILWVQSIIDKSRNRGTGPVVNAKTTLRFPNGDRVRYVFPDVEFGSFPFNVGGRTDFVSVKVDFVGSEGRAVAT